MLIDEPGLAALVIDPCCDGFRLGGAATTRRRETCLPGVTGGAGLYVAGPLRRLCANAEAARLQGREAESRALRPAFRVIDC